MAVLLFDSVEQVRFLWHLF